MSEFLPNEENHVDLEISIVSLAVRTSECSLLPFLLLLYFIPAGKHTSMTLGVSAHGSVALVSAVHVIDHNVDCYYLYVALSCSSSGCCRLFSNPLDEQYCTKVKHCWNPGTEILRTVKPVTHECTTPAVFLIVLKIPKPPTGLQVHIYPLVFAQSCQERQLQGWEVKPAANP